MASVTEDIQLLKFGVKFQPPALVMTYSNDYSRRRRTIPIRSMTKDSIADDLISELYGMRHHEKYLKKLTKLQLMRMLMLIKDHLNGLTLAQSLERSKELDHIDPNEDLNKADQETLDRKKAAMDEVFTQHQKKPTDPDFQYDIQVDFGTNDAVETVNWSDDDDDFGF